MHLSQHLLLPIAVWSNVVQALTPHINHAPDVRVDQVLVARAAPSTILIAMNDSSEGNVKLQAGPAQIILNGCDTEFNGVPVLDCSFCGGESATHPMQCVNLDDVGGICRCNPSAPGVAIVTTVVTVVSGGLTGTGTYELETLTQYATLREHITITTTMSVSTTATSDADTGVGTVVAVVLAGGVTWFLAEYAGAGALIELIEPPKDAPDHSDDDTCPDPKDDCADCGGEVGMCKTGADSGCGCEDSTCPADGADNQPACGDDTGCAGDESQCTIGPNEGCNCSGWACPALDSSPGWGFFCSLCGGADASGDTCLGIADETPTNLWQACPCNIDPAWDTVGQVRPIFDTTNRDSVWAALPTITYSSVVSSPTSTPLPGAQCTSSDVSNIPYNVFLPGVYTNFCNDLNAGDKTQAFSQSVNSTGDVVPSSQARKRGLQMRTPPANPAQYSSYVFDLAWTGGDSSCSSDCATVYYNIAQSVCGHSGGQSNQMTNSATLDTGCGTYSYTISNPSAGVIIPPTRTDLSVCNNPANNIYKDFTLAWAEDAISQFCANDQVLPGPPSLSTVPITNSYAYEEVNVVLVVGWVYEGQAGCGSTTNADGTADTTVSAAQCSQYLLSAVNNCNTNTRTQKYGSTYTWSSPIGCVAFGVSGSPGGAGLG